MRNALRISLLGGLHITRDGSPLPGFASRKGQALLGYLALTRRAHSRDALAGLLWSEAPQEEARSSLRTVLSMLRRVADPHLTIARNSVAFNPDSRYWLDVDAFVGKLQAASAGNGGTAHGLREAVELYRGEFLEGFYVQQAPAFDEWVLGERQWLHGLAAGALHRLASEHAAQGDIPGALDYLNRLLVLEPWREEAHQQVMRLLAESGQRTAALEQYATARRILLAELGVEPSRETTALYEQIVHRELGNTTPIHVSDHATATVPRVPHNLPASLNSLIGRDVELTQLTGRLQRPGANGSVRLLTLVGPGGNGKTRLALEVASQLTASFPDGVYFVPLAALNRPELMPAEIARALEVPTAPDRPALQALTEWLAPRRVLLMLDNLEHLLDGAYLIAALLEAAPGLKVLVTSREPLHLVGEHQYPVQPLQVPNTSLLPPPATLEEYPAVALFCVRARAAQPGFELTGANAAAVVEICRRLDGSPLAIELAAARVTGLGVDQIARRLDDRFRLLQAGSRDAPERLQTLRASIDWSYALLSARDGQLLRYLSVFAGGWTMEAAEAVCRDFDPEGEPDPDADVLDGVLRLVDKSLVVADPEAGRYRMHETIHRYATEKLVGSKHAEAIWLQHAAYFLAFAEEAGEQLKGPNQAEWLERLDAEHDNLRSALSWAESTGHSDIGLRLAASLGQFWSIRGRGYWAEGRAWLDRLLAAPPVYHNGDDPHMARARALSEAGWLASQQQDYPAARMYLEESLQYARALGDHRLVASSLGILGHVVSQEPDYERARALYRENLEIRKQLGDKRGISVALNRLGLLALLEGDYEQSHSLAQEGLAVRREVGDRRGISYSLRLLGEVDRSRGDYEAARAHYGESLAIDRQLGDNANIAMGLYNLGHVAHHEGDPSRAATMFRESLEVPLEAGDRASTVSRANCLVGLGGVAAALHQPGRATTLLGAAAALLMASNSALEVTDRMEYERNLTAAQAQLNGTGWEDAWYRGQAMTLEQAVAYAAQED